MKKRLLSMLLALAMLLLSLPVFAGETSTITVYLTISRYSEIVNGKNGELVAYVPISLNGKQQYNLDDLFAAAHEKYYPDGIDGYRSEVDDWGLGLKVFWGDSSGNFGYQINGGTVLVSNLEQVINQGDYIDAFIYKSYADESYAKFDEYEKNVVLGEKTSISLLNVSGYDSDWAPLFSPCSDATLIINNKETDIITDENGTAEISFENEGVYIISAKKTKASEEAEINTITAPVCVIRVGISEVIQLIHNIAEYYSECDFDLTGGNLPWIIADMAVYEYIYPDSENALSDARKNEALEKLTVFAENAETPGDLAKTILAIRALGYNTENIYTNSFKTINLLEKLLSLVESGSESVANIYTLPYVIIAMSQYDEQVTGKQIEKLIDVSMESAVQWQDVTYGTDAIAPMVFALAPFYEKNDSVKSILDSSVGIIKNEQREDGLINGFEGYEPASTGLVICALSSLGIDCSNVTNNGLSLTEGLLTVANEELNGFSNEFAREQGFRGLLSWCIKSEGLEKKLYDFSDYPKSDINMPMIEYCPVKFDVIPSDASVTIENIGESNNNLFDLNEGVYSYTVSATGYYSKKGTLTIGSDDVQSRTLKNAEISLEKKQSSGGGGGGGGGSRNDHKEDDSGNKNDDLNDASDINPSEQGNKTPSVAVDYPDVNKDEWYYPAVLFVSEKNLIKGTDKGFEPNTLMTRGMLVTVLHRFASPDTSFADMVSGFEDVPFGAWYFESVNWANSKGIVYGISDTLFAPEANVTREQAAAIIYRFATQCGLNTDISGEAGITCFKDENDISSFASDAVAYVIQKGIMNGRTAETFEPKEYASRAEVSAIIMRFAEVCENEK